MGNTLQTPSSPPQERTHNDGINNPKEQEMAAEQELNGVEEEEEEEEKAEQESSSIFTCEICIEPTTKKSTPHTITSCAHRYCVDCTIKYIRVKVEDDGEAQIKCPAPDCTRTLDPVACAPLVGPSTFVRWCDALCWSSLSGSDTCHCPYADCSELLLSDCKNKQSTNKTNKQHQCPKCKRWLCFACKKVWHAGFGCEDAPTDRADVAFGRLAARMRWTRCPSCRHFVELRGGCPVVTCRCGIGFCYKCGNKIQRCSCHNSRAHVVQLQLQYIFWLMCLLAFLILLFGVPIFILLKY